MVHPSPILLEPRLGSRFILSRSALVPSFQGATFSVRGGLALGVPRLQRCFIAAVAGSRAGLGTSAPTFAQLVGYPTPPAGRLARGVMLPTLRPWAGLVALCCKPASGGALGGLGSLVDRLGLGLGLLGCRSLGGGLRLALGLALCSRGAAHGLGNEFADVN